MTEAEFRELLRDAIGEMFKLDTDGVPSDRVAMAYQIIAEELVRASLEALRMAAKWGAK